MASVEASGAPSPRISTSSVDAAYELRALSLGASPPRNDARGDGTALSLRIPPPGGAVEGTRGGVPGGLPSGGLPPPGASVPPPNVKDPATLDTSNRPMLPMGGAVTLPCAVPIDRVLVAPASA